MAQSIVLKLIEVYLGKAENLCSLLRFCFDIKDESLLRAKVTKKLPPKGNINGVKYKFHGIGCYFEYKEGAIDLDFGPNDLICFNEFKLYDFIRNMESSSQSDFTKIFDEKLLDKYLNDFVAQGTIKRLDPLSVSRLYFFPKVKGN